MKTDIKILIYSIIVALIFTLIIWVVGSNLQHVALLPDQGALWYYWKLPEPQFWARFTAWLLFLLHLISTFVIYYLASKNRKAFDSQLSKYNYWMIAANALFIALHIVQTYIWYDGLAQDTPVWLSQFSVIIMLVLGLIMLNDKRGLFFGKKVKLPRKAVNAVYKWHGYYILLAIIYTFWFHPTESTPGHLMGFLYMFLLLIQSNMIYTSVHLNKIWLFVLEFAVLLHGTTVAILQGNNMWPMFAFGFGFLAVVTQIYILNLKLRYRIILQILYLIAVAIVYSGVIGFKTFNKVYEISFIPMIEYLLIYLFIAVIWIGIKITSLFRP